MIIPERVPAINISESCLSCADRDRSPRSGPTDARRSGSTRRHESSRKGVILREHHRKKKGCARVTWIVSLKLRTNDPESQSRERTVMSGGARWTDRSTVSDRTRASSQLARCTIGQADLEEIGNARSGDSLRQARPPSDGASQALGATRPSSRIRGTEPPRHRRQPRRIPQEQSPDRLS